MKSRIKIVMDEHGPIAKKYRNGYAYAIRYAKGMTEEDVLKSLANNPPLRREWRPFDEMSNTFMD